MVTINTNLMKELTTKINKGVEGERTVRNSELIELKMENNKLILCATNTQYYLSMELPNLLTENENLHFTVDADSFIKLIQKTTTPEIQLKEENGNLLFKGNGEYIFPLELDQNGEIKILPEINIEPELSFEVTGDTLYSIYSFGNNELVNDVPVDTVQKYFYVDNLGAITYTESPYLNNFSLSTPFKILINDRLAQLFSLFRGQKVTVGLSKEYESNLYQNKISFVSGNIKLVAYLPDDSLVEKFPANQCRMLQEHPYPGNIKINRLELANALDRLNIFSTKDGNMIYKKAGKLNFSQNGLEIISILDKNKEFIKYEECFSFTPYSCYMNLNQLLRHAKANNENNIDIHYGNELCLMLKKDNYVQIIVEMEEPDLTLVKD